MTEINTVALYTTQPGTKIQYRGTDYVVVEHARTRTKISRVADRKMFVLNMNSPVLVIGNDDDALVAALEARAERQAERGYVAPTLKAGTKVRFVDDERTRKAGLAGTETVIVRVNTKTYGLANGYRVGPSFVEAV